MRLVLIAMLLVAGFSVQAQAQPINIVPGNHDRSVDGKVERVTVSFQLSTPTLATTSPPDLTGALQTASRKLFDAVGAECQVLNAVLKGDCRLMSVSTNGNVGNRTNLAEANFNVTVTITANYEIVAKADPDPAPASK